MMPRVTVALVLTLLTVAVGADAQCAMCVTALEQNGGEMAAGFNRGILFLLGMPYLVFGAIGVGHYLRKRRREDNGRRRAELQTASG